MLLPDLSRRDYAREVLASHARCTAWTRMSAEPCGPG